jgi:hypothetical protein
MINIVCTEIQCCIGDTLQVCITLPTKNCSCHLTVTSLDKLKHCCVALTPSLAYPRNSITSLRVSNVIASCLYLQVVEYNETSSLYEQLLQMQKTGVFISVHTSNLANAPLLQPGSAVFEILQVITYRVCCSFIMLHIFFLMTCNKIIYL